jgi:hypothetical protein
MREFLITKLVCSRCGDNLQLTYGAQKLISKHAVGEPTGAEMVELRVAVEPCQCVSRPLEDTQNAAKLLLGLVGP